MSYIVGPSLKVQDNDVLIVFRVVSRALSVIFERPTQLYA
jgi:hypothetical protein